MAHPGFGFGWVNGLGAGPVSYGRLFSVTSLNVMNVKILPNYCAMDFFLTPFILLFWLFSRAYGLLIGTSAGQVRSFSAFLRSCVRTHRLFRNARTQERKVFQRNASKRNAPPVLFRNAPPSSFDARSRFLRNAVFFFVCKVIEGRTTILRYALTRY